MLATCVCINAIGKSNFVVQCLSGYSTLAIYSTDESVFLPCIAVRLIGGLWSSKVGPAP